MWLWVNHLALRQMPKRSEKFHHLLSHKDIGLLAKPTTIVDELSAKAIQTNASKAKLVNGTKKPEVVDSKDKFIFKTKTPHRLKLYMSNTYRLFRSCPFFKGPENYLS